MTTALRWVWLGLLAPLGMAAAGPPDDGPGLGRTHLRCAAFSPDGRRILTASGSEVRLWDVETGKELRRFEGHEAAVHTVAFSPDGKRVATGAGGEDDMGVIGKDKTARLWDAATGAELRRFPHGFAVNSFGFSPDGTRLLTVTHGGDVAATLWDADSGGTLHRFRVFDDEYSYDDYLPILSAATFSPDGRAILARGWRRVTILDAATGEELRRLEGPPSWVRAEVFSPDGRAVLVAYADGTARTWDARTGEPSRAFEGHRGPVKSAVFDAEGQRIVTASEDATARLWDAATGRELRRFLNAGPVNHAMFSRDGHRIIANWQTRDPETRKNYATLWDADTGRKVRQIRLRPSSFISLFSPDGSTLFTASEPATLWDAETGEPIRRYGP